MVLVLAILENPDTTKQESLSLELSLRLILKI